MLGHEDHRHREHDGRDPEEPQDGVVRAVDAEGAATAPGTARQASPTNAHSRGLGLQDPSEQRHRERATSWGRPEGARERLLA